MFLDGCYFRYGDFDSQEYRLIFAHCDTSDYSQLEGSISSSYIFNKRDKARYIVDDIYDDSPIVFEAEIVTEDAKELHPSERRIVEKALFNKSAYQKLYTSRGNISSSNISDLIYGMDKDMYFNCRFMNPTKIISTDDKVVGYKFSVECDSCMTWQDAVHKSYAIPQNGLITVPVDTDIGGYTYPKVSIKIGSTGGDISIVNTYDEPTRITKFVGLSPNITLVMNGRINYISGQNYEKFSGQNFIRLLDGDNTFSINGDVDTVEFEWNNRRFV